MIGACEFVCFFSINPRLGQCKHLRRFDTSTNGCRPDLSQLNALTPLFVAQHSSAKANGFCGEHSRLMGFVFLCSKQIEERGK
jgi:hypothetical protein